MVRAIIRAEPDFEERLEELETAIINRAMEPEVDRTRAVYFREQRDAFIDLINDLREGDVNMMQSRVQAWGRALSFYLAPQSNEVKENIIKEILGGAELFRVALGIERVEP